MKRPVAKLRGIGGKQSLPSPSFRVFDPLQKNKRPGRKADAVSNPSYPALGRFKTLPPQSWNNLSDGDPAENLGDRVSFSRFRGFSLGHEVPDNSTICRFRTQPREKGRAKPLPIERTARSGEGLRRHEEGRRMARARYPGAARMGMQFLMDATAFNLKKAARMMAM